LRSEKTIYQASTNFQSKINSNEKLLTQNLTHFFVKNYFEREKIVIAILTLFFCLELAISTMSELVV